MRLDRVLAILDFRDGPRRGVAELFAVPHIFEAEFDHSGEGFGDTFFLSPIDPDLLALALEDWQVWGRWNWARARAACPADAVAAPADARRHEALSREIGGRLRIDPSNCGYYSARFKAYGPPGEPEAYLVEWHCELPLR